MKLKFPSSVFPRSMALLLAVLLFIAPLCAQQPAPPAKTEKSDPTFDTLLSSDSYKLYGEVRNVGQLLTAGGAGEIVEPILKLANPGPEFTSIVEFLKKHSEALANARLLFATWPARTEIPNVFVAIEFPTRADAAKFSPKLETFLPKVLPPVPVQPEPSPESSPAAKPSPQSDSASEGTTVTAEPNPSPKPEEPAKQPTAVAEASPQEMRSPFVITHAGRLVFISDKTFKLEKLHPESRQLLAEDQNFRVARDRFSSEPIFLFFNVELEDRTRPRPSPTPFISDAERQRLEAEEQALIDKQVEEEQARAAREAALNPAATPPPQPNEEAILVAGPPSSPTPTPTREEESRMIASAQIGNMMSMLGQGEPQWPEAIGVALALDNDEYVARAILIDAPNSKRLTLPFVPQLISGPARPAGAASILPDNTEVLVSASIDFTKTYQEMKKQAEISAKNTTLIASAGAKASLDSFAEFEKKARIKIVDDLLPVLGNELAIGASLEAANMANVIGVATPPAARQRGAGDQEKPPPSIPTIVIEIKDREAARRLMPRVLEGVGLGAANLLAQTERRDDSEIVSYANIFSYAFVGDFLVIADSASVRRIAEANASRQTLSANNAFRNARHWQPRQTLGEIYVSPALMEGYQEQLRKQAGTLDQSIRDFLMQLSPKSSAITYTLSHDGLGALHELHLPKNLILAMVAGTSATMSAMKQGSPDMNEMIAISALQVLANGEETYKTTAGNGSYGSIDELVEKKLLAKDMFEKYGYKYDVTTSANGFEAVATPAEYGKTGKRSFFVDQSGVVRGDDHGGGPASRADKPVQ